MEIEFTEVGKVPASDSRSRVHAAAGVSRKCENGRRKADGNDEISQVFSVRAVGTRTAPYVKRVLCYAWYRIHREGEKYIMAHLKNLPDPPVSLEKWLECNPAMRKRPTRLE